MVPKPYFSIIGVSNNPSKLQVLQAEPTLQELSTKSSPSNTLKL
jgi:hypothetical protein